MGTLIGFVPAHVHAQEVTPSPAPSSTSSQRPLSREDIAIHACMNAVRANEIRDESESIGIDETDTFQWDLTGLDRVASCVARAGFKQGAILILTAALHNGESAMERLSEDEERALKHLADLEFEAGNVAGARRHIASAYASMEKSGMKALAGDRGIAADFKRISPQGLQSARQDEATAFRKETQGLSDDERSVYAEMGWPDHVESYQSSGYDVETWWYGKETYIRAYTFTNGAQTSTYDP
jgi:hypothetical protein